MAKKRTIANSEASDQSIGVSPPRNFATIVEQMSSPELVDLHIPVREPELKSSGKPKRKRLLSANVRKIDPLFMPGNNAAMIF